MKPMTATQIKEKKTYTLLKIVFLLIAMIICLVTYKHYRDLQIEKEKLETTQNTLINQVEMMGTEFIRLAERFTQQDFSKEGREAISMTKKPDGLEPGIYAANLREKTYQLVEDVKEITRTFNIPAEELHLFHRIRNEFSIQLNDHIPDNLDYLDDLLLSHLGMGHIEKNLGNLENAKLYFQNALQIAKNAQDIDNENVLLKRYTHNALLQLGDAERALGNNELAAQHYATRLQLLEEFTESNKATDDIDLDELLHAQLYMGNVFWHQGDYDAAEDYFNAGLEKAQLLLDEDNDSISLKQNLANFYFNLGTVEFEKKDYSAARSYFEDAIPVRRDIVDHPEGANTDNWYKLTSAIMESAFMSKHLGDIEYAERRFMQSLTIRNGIAAKYPNNAEYQHKVYSTLRHMGRLASENRQDKTIAKRIFEKALEYAQKTTKLDSQYMRTEGDAYFFLAQTELSLDNPDAAQRFLQKSLAIRKVVFEKDQAHPFIQGAFIKTIEKIGYLKEASGELDEARSYYQLALDQLTRLEEQRILAERHEVLIPQIKQAIIDLG